MSERLERAASRDKTPPVTPDPSRPDLMAWIEHKFSGDCPAYPKYFQLKVAVGPGGHSYKEQTIHQHEFKANPEKVTRPDMVTISNGLVAIAQNHCNELGKPQGFVILAINHMISAHPYGIFFMRLRPTVSMGMGGPNADDDVLADEVHRDRLFRSMHEHVTQNDEHQRWMQDSAQKMLGDCIRLYQDMITKQSARIESLEGRYLEFFKSHEDALSKADERKMAAAAHQFKIDALQHGIQFFKQMVPVVAKTLERNRVPELAGAPVTDSPESIAIKEFAGALSEEQKAKLFGTRDETTGKHSPGVFTIEQVRILGAVADLEQQPGILDLLMEGNHAITPDQIVKAQEHVPADRFTPLYLLLKERQRQKAQN